MKLTTILVLSACLTVSAGGSAQTFTLSQKNVKLENVFKEIRKQTGYVFFYDAQILRDAGSVTVDIKNESVEDALKASLDGQPLDFSIERKTITIFQKAVIPKPIVTISPVILLNIITGTVKDQLGNPLEGVSVIIKGSKRGTTTRSNGEFTITANAGEVLEFSFVGYKKATVTLGKNTNITINMEVETVASNEVVVIGYGTQKKANLTGAVSSIKSEDFIDDRPAKSVAQALQGEVPGLSITRSSGKPGKGYSFNIRGTTSLNGGSPLLLVDGSEILDQNLISPSDIESVTVLKDASSAAIYGARAAFGVILITTKSGKINKKPKFNYSTNISRTTPTTLPEKVDPITQITIGALQWENAGRTPGVYWVGNAQTWIDLYNSPNYIPNSVPVVNGVAYPLGDNNNMVKYMVEPSLTTQHNFSISGGSEKTTFYLSGGLMNEDGIIILNKDKYSRKNILSKIETEIQPWMNVGATFGFTKGVQNMPYIPNNEDYMYDVAYLRPTFWPIGMDTVSKAPWGYSPELIALGAENTFATDNSVIQLRTTIKPFKGLNIIGNYTRNMTSTNDSYQINKYLQSNPPGGPGSGAYYRNNPNSLRKTTSLNNYDNLSVIAEYTKTIAAKHNFKAMVGYTQEQSSYSQFFAERQELISDDVPALSLATGLTTVGDNITKWATRSGLYRFNYDFKGKYLLEAVGRYDGSSRFSADNRYVFMPSASMGWVVSKESFMNWSSNWLSFLKFRASYGSQGNQQVGAYSYISSMNTGTANWIIGSSSPTMIRPGGLVSNAYTWEKVKTTNFGADLNFFKNRLQTKLDVYQRQTIGMLRAAMPLPSTLGAAPPNENAADLKVKGWELSIDWSDRIGKDLSYRVGIMCNDYQTTITRYNNPSGILSSYYVDQKLGQIWGYQTDRLFQESDFTKTGSTRNYANGIPTQSFIFANQVPFPGDVKYADLNMDGKIDNGTNTLANHGDLRIIGNTNPRYQFGFKLGASFRNFDFDVFAQGVAKKDLWTSDGFGFTAGSQFESVYKFTLDYWTAQNTTAFYPRPDDRSYNKQVQTKYLLNAAYLRVKSINIGYNISENLCKKIHMEKVRFYFTGENLFTFTGLPKGLDPELGAAHTFPLNKDFSFGANINF